MARRGSTGEIRVMYVPSIANKAAPTATEVGAGTNLTPDMLRDGLDTPLSAQTLDAGDAADKYNATVPDTYGGDPVTYTGHRHAKDTDDDSVAWSTLVRGTGGYIVVRRNGGSDVAIAANDVVEVWPIEVISRAPSTIGSQTQRFTATCAVPSTPELDAVVAL